MPKNSIDQFFNETENLTNNGNLEEAQKKLNELLNKQELIRARAHNDSGVICYRQGDKEKAIEHYKKAVKLAPEEPVYRKNLADFYYFELGSVEIALAHYRQIIVDDPRDFDANLAIGRICADLGKHFLAEAKDFFALAEKIRPDDELLAEELIKLQNCINYANDKPSEQSQRQSVKTDNPEDAYSNLANSFKPGQEADSERKLIEFLNRHPNFALAHNDLGVISYQLKKFENAGRCYREAVRLAPDNITFRKNLADFLFIFEKQPEEALTHYHEALKNNPKDVEILMMIGNICLALGSPDEARDFYNLVLNVEPWNFDAEKALEIIDKKESVDPSDNND